MATAGYDISEVANAAKAKIARIRVKQQQFQIIVDERFEKSVIKQMEPKWYRPWKQSRGKAEKTVKLENFYSFSVNLDTMNVLSSDLRRAKRIAYMAAHPGSTSALITLDHNEYAFLFEGKPVNDSATEPQTSE